MDFCEAPSKAWNEGIILQGMWYSYNYNLYYIPPGLFSDSSCKIDRIRQEGQYQCIISGNKGEYTAQIEGEWKTEFDMN